MFTENIKFEYTRAYLGVLIMTGLYIFSYHNHGHLASVDVRGFMDYIWVVMKWY